ncbi:MAG TPA: FIST C-terminal domain-containing protein [Catalimonadaceae bacterium]|nr:FIST C-terminal domain-containing protein [Catalimonadaceae bacterium]
MVVHQLNFQDNSGWDYSSIQGESLDYQLIIVFGSRELLSSAGWFQSLRKKFLKSDIVSVSTSGNILGSEVSDDSLVASLLYFGKTRVKTTMTNISSLESSREAGIILGSMLQDSKLQHVMVFSEGIKVNGSELVSGLNEVIQVPVTGGLAGDAARFEKTLVGLNSLPESGNIVGIGFYGESLKVGFGHFGGWDSFGPERRVTKSDHNILYELDNKSALELYKTYLGDKAKELPGSALLFPLGMRVKPNDPILTRTILTINPDGGMVFAGDLPEGAMVQLMKANFEKLIDASATAAEQTLSVVGADSEFALLISCVGRKLVLGQRIEEEVDAVRDVLGEFPKMSGFYSYGEISTVLETPSCELHNQTMTITVMKEE